MKNWSMVTVVGKDQPGIVAKITAELSGSQCNLGEASMLRLGGSFTMMMMVQCDGEAGSVSRILDAAANRLQLHVHVDAIAGELHQHLIPSTRVVVSSTDRVGLISQTTSILADAGFNIINLESDVAGSESLPIYIMTIEGKVDMDAVTLEQQLENGLSGDLDVSVSPIEMLMG